ncbi:MAG: hypothetical protein JWR21_971 [Herminiimonas sp.]|nr:hypothetical protein [Herminiimonas sp.]MDB5852375.1 hypothetical protein [Herminiimonas sp.]
MSLVSFWPQKQGRCLNIVNDAAGRQNSGPYDSYIFMTKRPPGATLQIVVPTAAAMPAKHGAPLQP